MEEDEFEKYKESLAVQRLEKPKTLSAECSRFWSEITSQQYNFERGKFNQNIFYMLRGQYNVL